MAPEAREAPALAVAGPSRCRGSVSPNPPARCPLRKRSVQLCKQIDPRLSCKELRGSTGPAPGFVRITRTGGRLRRGRRDGEPGPSSTGPGGVWEGELALPWVPWPRQGAGDAAGWWDSHGSPVRWMRCSLWKLPGLPSLGCAGWGTAAQAGQALLASIHPHSASKGIHLLCCDVAWPHAPRTWVAGATHTPLQGLVGRWADGLEDAGCCRDVDIPCAGVPQLHSHVQEQQLGHMERRDGS